jgi:hypothetical protein
MDISEAEKDAFLSDLKDVFEKHRITIIGCGCCGSPFLMSVEESELPLSLTVNRRSYNSDWENLETHVASGKKKL